MIRMFTKEQNKWLKACKKLSNREMHSKQEAISFFLSVKLAKN